MNDQSSAPDAPEKLQTRPERRFEGRRRFVGLVLVGILLVGCGLLVKFMSNPLGGMNNIVQVAPTQTRTPRPTIRSQIITPPTLEPTATAIRPSSGMPVVSTSTSNSAGATGAFLVCWANQDILLDDKSIVPKDAMLRITGWTAARGGMVELQNLWVGESQVRCTGDPRQYERPFVMIPTRAVRVSAGAGAPVGPTIIYAPTNTPAPPVIATPTNGLWIDGSGCWHLNVDGVREIWVNGKGVSNGLYCAVNDLRVVAK